MQMSWRRWLLLSVGVGIVIAADDTLCPGSKVVVPDSSWTWSRDTMPYPSCTNPAVLNTALMCSGDPTSVYMEVNGSQCLAASMEDCKFDMRRLWQLDFDVSARDCKGTWAAPLWITPDHWAGAGKAGELDTFEFCPSDGVFSNFDGGGYQKQWQFDGDNLDGHVTLWNKNGSVTVKACAMSDMQGGSCTGQEAAYYPDLYDANGCSNGGNCIYSFVSDIWNGFAGDSGYQHCQGGQTKANSKCRFSVRSIRAQALANTFTGNCRYLTTPSPPPPPSPTCKVGDRVKCPTWIPWYCHGNHCCPDGTICPSANNSFKGCLFHHKTVDCTVPPKAVAVFSDLIV